MMLDAQPLRDVITARCWSKEAVALCYARAHEVSLASAYTAVNRFMTRDTMSVGMADRWCLTLGTDLSLIYPEVYSTPGACR